MKILTYAYVLLGISFFISSTSAQDRGEMLFNQTCVACHTIGSGRLVGPDLAGVHTRRDESWLIKFIQSPNGVIESGDRAASALLQEYAGLLMPDQLLSDDDVRAILGYIALRSPEGGGFVDESVEIVSSEDLTSATVDRGRNLFIGKIRFENRGAACNSCHNVNSADVMTGGSLGTDLTDAITRLTRPGVDAMMANPPFPAMRTAFSGKALTEDERSAIADFLQFVDAKESASPANNYGNTLFIGGLVGLALLLGIFFLLGKRGAKHTVNHDIYERQIKSS
ncbi:MAG: hypothetical protein BMS9Abin05_2244 [Rhodothermia bacterium]|nr:MAG: hypothetical protein BMS9Abin05_2244 [Rhodothermia bacterium]